LDTIAVVLIVCLAAGYLVWRYVKRAGNIGGCECENTECPLKHTGTLPVESQCKEMVQIDPSLDGRGPQC